MTTTLLTTGLACIIAAIVGGGLKAFSIEMPVFNSLARQLILAAFGTALLVLAIVLRPPTAPDVKRDPNPSAPAANPKVPDVQAPKTILSRAANPKPRPIINSSPQPVPALTWGPLVGGDGGTQFTTSCKEDEVLVGLVGRSNQTSDFRVFAIGPICSRAHFEKPVGSKEISVHLLGEPIESDQFGAQQGEPFSIRCSAGEAVIGTVFQSVPAGGNYLGNHLLIKCSPKVPGSGQADVTTSGIPGQKIDFATTIPFECANGQIASALTGRVGQWIDALAIGCRSAR